MPQLKLMVLWQGPQVLSKRYVHTGYQEVSQIGNDNTYVMLCTIWYHLQYLKNVKNTHGGMLLFVPAILPKIALLNGYFSWFLNCSNGTISRKISLFSKVSKENLNESTSIY